MFAKTLGSLTSLIGYFAITSTFVESPCLGGFKLPVLDSVNMFLVFFIVIIVIFNSFVCAAAVVTEV